MAADPKPGTARRVPRQDANLERRLEVLFAATRATDPGPRPTEPGEDQDLEQRLSALFGVTAGTNNPRPTDADGALAFAQELWDRLNRGRRAR